MNRCPVPGGALARHLVYPIPYEPLTFLERVMVQAGFGPPGCCCICGRLTTWRGVSDNLRETARCASCGAICRQRQLAYVACQSLAASLNVQLTTLRQLSLNSRLRVYNTEANGAVHATLKNMDGYVCSEYFGPQYASGDRVGQVVHQDLQNLLLPDQSFDLVLSGEVLEHVPQPYQAHREIFRVLRSGGRHIFTVPFDQTSYTDDVRAECGTDGKINYLKPPEYHGDPVRPGEGVLVYTVFGMEMLAKLHSIGFSPRMYRLRDVWLGLFGCNGIVFEAVKP